MQFEAVPDLALIYETNNTAADDPGISQQVRGRQDLLD